MATMTPNFAGAVLSISWVNVLLYMLEITLAIYYFTRYKAEIALLLRYLLFSLLLVDTVCLISDLASAWQLLIQSFQTYTIKETEWTAPLTTYMVAVSAVAEELFLINRCRRLMQSVFVLGILLAMVVTHAIMESYSGGYVVAFATDDPNARRYGSKGAAIVSSIAATVDIVIPIALIWQIHLVTPPHISRERSWRDTVVNTISSGGCGGIMTVILVVLFWVRPDIYYVLFNTMGHIYVITIFVNLLVSKRSPHEVPDDFQLRKFSFTANINLHTFTRRGTGLWQHANSDKQLPPTPGPDEAIFTRMSDTVEPDKPRASASYAAPPMYQSSR